MEQYNRAVRRHHYYRLKKKRQFYYTDFSDVGRPNQNCGALATSTPTWCSCWMCGNPRRHHKQRTRQEYRAYLDYAEGCEEAAVASFFREKKFGNQYF